MYKSNYNCTLLYRYLIHYIKSRLTVVFIYPLTDKRGSTESYFLVN